MIDVDDFNDPAATDARVATLRREGGPNGWYVNGVRVERLTLSTSGLRPTLAAAFFAAALALGIFGLGMAAAALGRWTWDVALGRDAAAPWAGPPPACPALDRTAVRDLWMVESAESSSTGSAPAVRWVTPEEQAQFDVERAEREALRDALAEAAKGSR